MIHVPYTVLSPEALRGVIEEFVTRAGTDYGARERTLVEKMADVHRQLVSGEATIVFDPESGTTDLVVPRSGKGQ